MDRRTNDYTALLIDTVLNARAQLGISGSARALYDIGIPLDVAVRLLTRPWERRHYTQAASDAAFIASWV